MDNENPISANPKAPKKKKMLWRLGLLAFMMLGLVALAKFTPLGEYFDADRLQWLFQNAGWWGVVAFFFIFLLGTLMNIPGAVFLVFAVFAYGYFWGTVLSYISALGCAMINFYFARAVGGQALSEIENPRLKKVMQKVEKKPIATIFWLRLIFLLSPIVNYTLALSNIKPKQFFIGNAIGMIPPIGLIIFGTVIFQTTFFKNLLSYFWG